MYLQAEADQSLIFFKHICMDTLGEHYNMFNYDPNQDCDGNNIQPIYIKGKTLFMYGMPFSLCSSRTGNCVSIFKGTAT
jgi:hypothetical protein